MKGSLKVTMGTSRGQVVPKGACAEAEQQKRNDVSNGHSLEVLVRSECIIHGMGKVYVDGELWM